MHQKYYNIGKSERYIVTNVVSDKIYTRSSWCKSFDPNIQPEKQTIKPAKIDDNTQIKPRMGQGRVGLRRKKPHINQPIAQSVEHPQKIP